MKRHTQLDRALTETGQKTIRPAIEKQTEKNARALEQLAEARNKELSCILHLIQIFVEVFNFIVDADGWTSVFESCTCTGVLFCQAQPLQTAEEPCYYDYPEREYCPLADCRILIRLC